MDVASEILGRVLADTVSDEGAREGVDFGLGLAIILFSMWTKGAHFLPHVLVIFGYLIPPPRPRGQIFQPQFKIPSGGFLP